jgi:predicted DNA-binding transcriptional regulator AlpA
MALAGVSEIAALLGLNRQRVSELSHRSDFPEPLDELLCGPVWLKSEILAYNKVRNKKPGRPPRKGKTP